jgi:hypothetical protein
MCYAILLALVFAGSARGDGPKLLTKFGEAKLVADRRTRC